MASGSEPTIAYVLFSDKLSIDGGKTALPNLRVKARAPALILVGVAENNHCVQAIQAVSTTRLARSRSPINR